MSPYTRVDPAVSHIGIFGGEARAESFLQKNFPVLSSFSTLSHHSLWQLLPVAELSLTLKSAEPRIRLRRFESNVSCELIEKGDG